MLIVLFKGLFLVMMIVRLVGVRLLVGSVSISVCFMLGVFELVVLGVVVFLFLFLL